MDERIFTATDVVEFSDDRAKNTKLAQTDDSAVFVWGVKPGQEVPAHIHPDGQDTWIMIQGTLTYYLGNGETEQIEAGQVDVAPKEAVHGTVNETDEDAIFVSIYSDPEIGFEEVDPHADQAQ
ncbi:cupin domain-containing protein [Haloterrigena alkaliphila]|uniref:Cupin domain-containing protein n=1 Tax=Haloterrigena alkaliphila TaxID=2816475 RepID=A0A8A2VF06_9EURY|nr:cupin domain-containing protein [Haloterrigena alkaliphila]QSW98994.1 cupin domain-containing protein [Haloterrigena alkaliphila]